MAAYIVRRLAWVIVLLFLITLITFVIFTVLPAADPAALRPDASHRPS
jgi:peptide/nickel transport system permease protein